MHSLFKQVHIHTYALLPSRQSVVALPPRGKVERCRLFWSLRSFFLPSFTFIHIQKDDELKRITMSFNFLPRGRPACGPIE